MVSFKVLEEITEGNKDFMISLLISINDSIKSIVSQIKISYQKNNYTKVKISAHKLKSSTSYLAWADLNNTINYLNTFKESPLESQKLEAEIKNLEHYSAIARQEIEQKIRILQS